MTYLHHLLYAVSDCFPYLEMARLVEYSLSQPEPFCIPVATELRIELKEHSF